MRRSVSVVYMEASVLHDRGRRETGSTPQYAWACLTTLWIFVCIYSPTFNLFGMSVRLDYPALLVVLALVCTVFRINRQEQIIAVGLGLFVLLFSISTLKGILYSTYHLDIALFLGGLKPLAIAFVWMKILRAVPVIVIMRVITWLLIGPALVIVGQLLDPTNLYDFTLNFYVTEGRSQVAERLLSPGSQRPFRAIGIFDTPAYAGTAMLIALNGAIICIVSAVTIKGRATYVALTVLYVAAGLATASSLFIGGAILTAAVHALIALKSGKLDVIAAVGLVVAGVTGIAFLIYNLSGITQVPDPSVFGEIYYRTMRLFDARLYTSRIEEGSPVDSVISRLGHYVIFGIGGTETPYLLTDNFYTVVLARFGVVGLLSLLTLVGLCIFKRVSGDRATDRTMRFLSLLMFAAGMGVPVIWLPRVSEIAVLFVLLGIITLFPRRARGDNAVQRIRIYNNGPSHYIGPSMRRIT